MRSWVFAAIPLALAAVIAGEYVAAPAPSSTRALLASLKDDLRFTYHDCVPLGWYPVPVRGTYYPGYTASAATYAEMLDALWRGRIRKRDLRNQQTAQVYAVLNHLTGAGLLARKTDAAGFTYFLTPRAYPYFYGSSQFKDNRDSLTYLCYSTIVPQRIDWLTHAAKPRWQVTQFSWKPSPPAAWANDPFLRAHSVVLAPLTSPTTARVAYRDGEWYLANIYGRGWMLPALKEQANAGIAHPAQ